MKRTFIYPAIIERDDDTFSVSFPDLKGCYTYAETIEDAIINAKEALELFWESLLEDSNAFPKPANYFDINKKATMIVAEIDYDEPAVEMTMSIPRWLSNEAERKHIDFSTVFQKALIEAVQQ